MTARWVIFFAEFKSQPFDHLCFSGALIFLLKRSRQISFKRDLTAMRWMARSLASCSAALDHAVGSSNPDPLINDHVIQIIPAHAAPVFSPTQDYFWLTSVFFV
jgi:hypothetical protein